MILSLIFCELQAAQAGQAAQLAAIARTCAKDVGQPIAIKTSASPTSGREPTLTLHLPVELAASQHEVWCLACRIACFCPGARVSVLVRGEAAFGREPRLNRRLRQRTA